MSNTKNMQDALTQALASQLASMLAPAVAQAMSQAQASVDEDEAKTEDSGPKVRLEVRSKNEKGSFRAGKHFGPEIVEVEVSEADAKRIEAEPQLFSKRLGAGSPKPAPAPVNVTPEPTAAKPEGGDAAKRGR